ncbi:MAG: glycerol-3-phosphate ABC transporter ATP-binding protein [Planctomycetota bacterium]|nr:MAG: glycerol-3-phosphate ABC transporter ATP-binding protein [Planctomycetota bacterium]
MARVTLTDVTKVYPGGVKAVDRVSLAIADREFVVLVGPSGCGKSTTLRMVAGLEDISDGTIEIDGRVVNQTPPKDRDIAMVFQNYALYPHMSVYKNMAFSLNLRRRELRLSKADIDRKVREAAAILGIEDLLERKPRALSGGQRQRVAVGRAIVRNPKAFLFDEPLSNLDAKLRVEMRSEIKRLQRRLATTTIYVTHDQEEAMTLGDRVVVMKDGIVHQVASPLEVYERPVNRFVASFLGTPPMGFIDGRVGESAGGLAFEHGPALLRLTPKLADAARQRVGAALVLGIRPDAFSTSEGTGGGSVKMRVRVTLVEPLGDRKDVHMISPIGTKLVGRVDLRAGVAEGQETDMFINMDRAALFEPGEMGRNLSAGREGTVAGEN